MQPDILADMVWGTHVRFRAGLMAVLALICAVITLTTAPTRAADPLTDPLNVTIDTMTPTTSSGDITLTGTVTNDDTQTWRAINILPFMSATPIQTTTGFAAATTTPANAVVGKRSTGAVTTIDQLDAGATTRWSLTVPVGLLPRTHAGVYWFGVHALGTSDDGVSVNADGRARTFLPVVSAKATPARVHLIVELTEHIDRDRTGHLMEMTSFASGAPTWAQEFSDHLAKLLSVVNHTPGADLLVDPAVVDAATKLADGNPGWLGDAGALADTKAAAQTWLATFKAVAKTHRVWALPYGDVDLSATADRPDIAVAAEAAALAPFRAIGVPAAPARRTPDLTASKAVVSGPPGSTAFVDARVGGAVSTAADVRVVGTALSSFGAPKPGAAYSVVGLRQEILAEAALHADSTDPVVVLIPGNFSPADPAGWASSLQQPWVSMVTLPKALESRPVTTFPTQPKAAGESPTVSLSVAAYDAALTSAGTLHTLTGLDIQSPVIRTLLPTLAPGSVRTPAAIDVAQNVADRAAGVSVTAPPGVTLSGTTGRFLLTLENHLPVQVKVGLVASTDSETSVNTPGSVTLAPGTSGSLLATVSVNSHGNHRVAFAVADTAGHQTGVAAYVTVRSVRVSGVIWAFIAGGVGLLGFAIVMRLLRRIRSQR